MQQGPTSLTTGTTSTLQDDDFASPENNQSMTTIDQNSIVPD